MAENDIGGEAASFMDPIQGTLGKIDHNFCDPFSEFVILFFHFLDRSFFEKNVGAIGLVQKFIQKDRTYTKY